MSGRLLVAIAGGVRPNLHDHLRLDRNVVVELGRSERETRVPAPVAEDFHQQVGRSIQDRRKLVEPRRAVDVPHNLDDPLDAVQVAEEDLEDRQVVDRRHSSGIVPLLERQLTAQLAAIFQEPTHAVGYPAQVDHVTNLHGADVVSHRLRRGWQLDTELLQALFDAQWRDSNGLRFPLRPRIVPSCRGTAPGGRYNHFVSARSSLLSPTVLVGMSGGVDSSVAAAMLVNAGHRVIGITLNVWPEGDDLAVIEREDACCALGAVEDARRVCAQLDVPHYVVNFRDVFQRHVIDNFVDEYRRGRTPNPCVRCNQFIKFDALLAKAEALGAEYVATGHYARIARTDTGRWALRKAADARKDQSYVLYVMTQERLARAIFPLGDLSKDETRRLAEDLGLHVAGKPESMEICFVPTKNYRDYLRQHEPASARPGPIVDTDGRVVGTHEGVAYYTVGQRRGLGIASSRPLFVTEILADENVLVIGDEAGLYQSEAFAAGVNWVAIEGLNGPMHATAKIRYKAEEAPVTIEPADGGVRVRFDSPQRAITPGQTIVFYDGDLVVGGGTLEAAVRREQTSKIVATAGAGYAQ
ncbi:MAG: tRNA 2-thiouridine(34) synthase MnmA [Chloroflexi bacterium]|nr:tRNA 2-thiouridine(34) synthase MnmA [Chloroflexota bacterium]